MKPLLEHLPFNRQDESFFCAGFDFPYFGTPWHYHPEIELVLIVKSRGTRVIGNTMSTFQEGDLSLLGSNLPHIYKNPQEHYQANSVLRAQSIIIHFNPNKWGGGFLQLPEAKKFVQVFESAKLGIDLHGRTRKEVTRIMQRMLGETGTRRLISLFDILNIIADTEELSFISESAIQGSNPVDTERLSAIYTFVAQYYASPIKLQEVADLVHLTKTSFCRFFLDRSKRTFSDFLLHFRLQKASEQLINTTSPIASIAYECGFRNLAFFNRKFKKKYELTPKQYRRTFTRLKQTEKEERLMPFPDQQQNAQ